MCAHCGCGVLHDHGQDEPHGHSHDHSHLETVTLEARILAKNDALAARNRAWLAEQGIFAVNLLSSPGSGKTTLLERTIGELRDTISLAVLEGDQATELDTARIAAAGVPAVQLNTGQGCHLEADMVARGLIELQPAAHSILVIENVGNLVCPALFDLGEHAKVVILSVAEGDDEPLKYPHTFRAASMMVVSKTDLLPHVDFSVDRAAANAKEINPDLRVMALSARTGEGMPEWYDWLRQEIFALRRNPGR